MYNKFFGFREKPFKLVPNPEYLFLSKSHEEALAHLAYAISQGEGFVEILGEVGTGKTTLCRVFLENLDSAIHAAYIFNPKLSSLQLLKAINDELGIDSTPDNTKDLIDRLNLFLIEKKKEGGKVLVLIDEAQNLSLDVLEQLRLLSNLETTREKLLQIILVGQPELGEMLSSHQLRQLGQRITINCSLSPLTFEETRDYIRHRISLASHRAGPPFDRKALNAIYEYSRGIPRLVNIACDRALLNAYGRNSFTITGAIAREAIGELARKKPAASGGWLQRHAGLAIVAAAVLPFIVVSLYIGAGKMPQITAGSKPAAEQGLVAGVQPPLPTDQPAAATPEPQDDTAAVQAGDPFTGPAESLAAEQTPGPEKTGAAPASRVFLQDETGAAAENTPPAASAAAGEDGEKGASPAPDADPVPQEGSAATAGSRMQTTDTAGGGFMAHLKSLNSRASRNSSIVEILKLWFPGTVLEMKKDRIANENQFFRAAAGQFGLLTLPLATESDLNIIERLNLPAVFTFHLEGHSWPKYLAITGIDGENVFYAADGQEEPVPLKRETLLQYWSGEAYIFWKNFKQLSGVISERSSGESVTALKEILRQAGHTIIDPTEAYDNDTRNIIRGIQAKYNLHMDGEVGAFTKIALYNESRMFKKPSLGRKREAGPENGS